MLGFLFELIPAVVLVILAYFYRSIWALIVGTSHCICHKDGGELFSTGRRPA